jgi:hypothetical protein
MGLSFATTFSWTEKEKEAKEEIWEMVLDAEQKKGSTLKTTVYPEEALKARTELPSQIVGSTKNYTKHGRRPVSPGRARSRPLNRWAPVYKEWKEDSHRSQPVPVGAYVTNYRGVHYGMLRAMIPFNKKSADDIENARHGHRRMSESRPGRRRHSVQAARGLCTGDQ